MGTTASPLAIIFAVLLPPLGVFLAQRTLGRDFWISVVLTIIGWLPGVVWSLFAMLRPRRALA